MSTHPFFLEQGPKIIGHRGAGGEAPENTLPSFEQAFKDGATIVELDVHGSKEGEPVIIHDASVRRTTNGRGQVRSKTLDALRELDAGYWFHKGPPSNYPFRGKDIKIPTLDEFLTTFREARAIIEIKQSHPSIVKNVIDTIRRLGREDRVLLATEKDDIMMEIRREIEKNGMNVATGFSYGEVAAFMRWLENRGEYPSIPRGQALQIPCEYAGIKLVSEQSLQGARELGVEVFVWTVNEPEEMRRLLNLGVDGIITDYPGRLRDLLGQNAPS